MKENHFKKNLKKLQKTNPSLVYHLSMTDPSDLEFCWTQQEEQNLKRLYDNQIYYYHSPIHALQEAQEWFQSLDLHLATIIFVYGIGLGYYYEAAKKWLKQHPHHHLVFLEEDLSVLSRFFETELCSRLLKDPQVTLVHLQDPATHKLIFNELSWTYFQSPFIFTSLKLYQQENPEGFSRLKHHLTYHLTQKKTTVEEYTQYGIGFFRNFFPNLLQLTNSYFGNALFNRFEQIPAIICGAGPSLNKNIDDLPFLKDRALIIAGGSALNALIPKKIMPHFGVAIDPNKSQYSRVAVTQPHHVPFFYRNRLFHEALTAIKGPRLFLTGSGGYQTAHWFEKKLNIEGEDLDEGHNVVNFSIQIAHALGCNPIILVGVDLAFTNQQFYADGIAKNLNLSPEELKVEATHDSDLVLQEDIYNNPVYTLWKWTREGEWISEFAEKHPETTFINATEGGIGFKGIKNVTLKEVIPQFLHQTHPGLNKIDKEIKDHPLNHIDQEHIVSLMLEMKGSLDQCILFLSKLIEAGNCIEEQIREGLPFPSDLHTPEISLLEANLEGEIGYQYLLEIFDKIFIHSHHRDFQDLHLSKRRSSKEKKGLKQLELRKQRLIFLRDTALCNRELIESFI